MEFNEKLAAFIVKRHDEPKSTNQQHHHRFPFGDDLLHGGKVLKSSPNFHLHSHNNNNQVMEVEAVILEDLIKPLIFMSKYFLPFQNVMKYDPVARRIITVKGSFSRKTICIVWELLVLYRMIFKLLPSAPSESAISTGADVVFIIFDLGWFHYFWRRTSNCCDIFNHVLSLADSIYLKQRSPSRSRTMKCGVHSAWIYSTFYVVITVILYMIQFWSLTKSSTGLQKMPHLNSSSEREASSSSAKFGFDAGEIHVASDYNVMLQIASTIASLVTIFYWTMSYWHFGAWALFFRQLLILFYWRIETKRELGEFIIFPEEIRTYNRIVSIMNEYNGISGIPNVLSAIVVVVYVSTSVKHAFSNFLDIFQIGAGLHLVLSYIPLTVVAIWLADVERVAGLFADILKEEYGRFNKDCGDPAESLCGISMVHYDLSTSNIGFKGFGFYTVSYKFITTIVGAIITYSILVVQLSPRGLYKSLEP